MSASGDVGCSGWQRPNGRAYSGVEANVNRGIMCEQNLAAGSTPAQIVVKPFNNGGPLFH